jgi:hypothetical protein
MRKRFALTLATVSLAAAALAPSASAAVEFGDTCVGNDVAPGEYTLTTLSAPAGPLPLTAPTSGVITKLKMQIDLEAPLPFQIPTVVKTLRPVAENTFAVIGQSVISAGSGLTVADARIPVQAGDRLALQGQPFTFAETPLVFAIYCGEVEGVLGATMSLAELGSNTEFPPAAEGRVPLAAVIEADADGDGYGDETQDQCPQSAATHGPCPVVTLDAIGLGAKRSVKVFVAADRVTPVSVSGIVNLGKGRKATLSAPAQTVPIGQIARFTLKFPAPLTKRLKELPRKRKLALTITASAADVIGRISSDTTTAKLKGEAKPERKAKSKAGAKE